LTFRRLAINGKFLTAGPTGVHRVAEQLIHQLEGRVDDFADLFKNPPTLIGPPNLHLRSFGSFDVERGGVFRGQLWEQLDLPRLTRPDLLLNLCNLGPMASTAAITMIHDAQVFVTPDSYRWGFVRWYRNILPVLGRRHARILTVSEFSADELARFGVARRDHISVVPNGVDHLLDHASQPQVLGRLALASRRFVVGLANVQPHKNIGLLLKAFAASELSGLKLVLVGTGRREEFERLGHVVSPNVVFAGRITDGELRALLEWALCIACPSTTEGFGLPPLEGMTFGCPAILAPCGALAEVAGEAAMFAAATDPRQWVHAIRSLVDEPARWAEYSQAGRARAALFTWRRAGQKLVEVIRETATRLLSERH
jgi:glycosyltransferase involved in cell wall biosynthesis